MTTLAKIAAAGDSLLNTVTYGIFTAANTTGLQSTVQTMTGSNLGEYVYYDAGAQVADGIYIGSLATATSESCLKRHGIDIVVNLSGRRYPLLRPTLYIQMDDADITPNNLNDYTKKFAAGCDFVEAARRKGQNVLIHCAAGINRSATLIGFYLIERGKSYDAAVALLSAANNQRRVPLLTNNSFRYLLQTRDSFRRNFDKKSTQIK
jgi:hypothetical protein